ncbi:HlyD family efflux transporter periplasmic adaptor subunit [Pedobacter jeongneungensis]|uniref:HlyD family efflux transporter periplasmic adaptor subunit n=1 Tax=Pedobacter jeongneungensis TaxID=947309 RepID=UPI00046A6895|nr:HlyD family efflux transporter periplasmic adaptor subunit [Pedobacter jeongneungensis]
MPNNKIDIEDEDNSEEIQDILTAVPNWLLRFGITIAFFLMVGIILMSHLISYPETVRTGITVNMLNAPKAVLSRQTGKISQIIVTEGQQVISGQVLAFLESSAKAPDILLINERLRLYKTKLLNNNNGDIELPTMLNLGELQSAYQNFYQQYLRYKSTLKDGYYLKQIDYLDKDLKHLSELESKIADQKKIQSLEFKNQEIEYQAYQKLYKNGVISRSEFAFQENKYLSSQSPLNQSESSLLSNRITYSSKERDLATLKQTIFDEKLKFIQSLNECITQSDNWIMQFVLRAPVNGKISFSGIVQENQNVVANQEVFLVNPGNDSFFGEVKIPQYNMGKVHDGERVLIRLRSYPYEQFGILQGKLSYISDVAYRDSVFLGKVTFKGFDYKKNTARIKLKSGMQGEAEIITQESTLLQRFFRNIIGIFRNNG